MAVRRCSFCDREYVPEAVIPLHEPVHLVEDECYICVPCLVTKVVWSNHGFTEVIMAREGIWVNIRLHIRPHR